MAQFDEKTGERIYSAQPKAAEPGPEQVKPDEPADKKNQPKAAEPADKKNQPKAAEK